MNSNDKKSKRLCFIFGLILLLLFFLEFYKEVNAQHFQGTVYKVYDITEKKEIGRGVSDNTSYSAYIDVFFNEKYYKIQVSRKFENNIPKEGDIIRLIQYSDGSVCEYGTRNKLSLFIVFVFGTFLVYIGVKRKK